MSTRNGKIARLPHSLRIEVNRRLLDGQTSRQILSWLNNQPEAIALWESDYEGVKASASNLSEWRLGGFKEWRARGERIENLKTLSTFAMDLTKAGGSLADGAASILSGQILEALEQAGNLAVTGGSDDAETDPNEGLAKMAQAISSLQKASTSRGKLELDKKRLAQKEREIKLAEKKFESQTVAKFLEWARSPEAQKILDSGKTKDAILSDLRQLMFGSRPRKEEPPQ